MKDNSTCILLVDDERRMVMGLRDFFRAKDYVVYSAYDGHEALELYYQHNTEIDIILLDVMMPVMDGFEMLEELRKLDENVPVIMLTAKGEDYDQLQGFQKGVDDYVIKPFSPAVLLARVETILKRVNKNNLEQITCGDIALDMKKKIVMVQNNVIDMTRREFDLIHFMMLNQGIALSREQLLGQVWGYGFEGDARTVDTHIKQLRMKLERCGNYIKTVRMVGYMFEVE